MDDKLVPAHVLFDRWFIRIRWIALLILLTANYFVRHVFGLPIRDLHVYLLSAGLFTLNCLHLLILKGILEKGGHRVIQRIKLGIHFQIITDLIILTLILHYTGGIENPLILFYFFHMIIASSIFSTLESYIHAAFALLLAGLLAFSECYSLIPHYHLQGFVNEDLYRNTLFLYGAGFIFAATSIILVSLTHMIISRSIKTEETYVKTNLELENKDKLKNEYVLRVTHDIKGHLAAIISCLEVVRTKIAGPLTDTQEEFVNRAFERTEMLTGFVKDLLNLTKKRLIHDLEFEFFSIKELVNKLVTHMQIHAKDKSIEFNVFIDSSVNSINGNPFMIEELYSNLLLNAIKYTPPHGHIELSIRNRPEHIISEISDSGIGIPKEELSKVFDEFYRGSNVPKDIKTGSGLGLSIVKQIIDTHKGRIWVSSEEGAWTKITFQLPKDPVLII